MDLLRKAGVWVVARSLTLALAICSLTLAGTGTASAAGGTEAQFFRTAAGAEIDLLLKLPGRPKPWAIEVKRGLAPKIDRGFHLACDTIQPERRLVVYGGVERFPLAEGVEAVSLGDLSEQLSAE